MIDEIITKATTSNGYDKESYKKMKREQLDNAYKMIDESLQKLKDNPSFLKEYLDVQSKFDMYTPRNALLITKQFPNAMQLKTRKDWLDSKATFKQKNQNKIIILEPGETYENKNGVKVTPMNAKEVIDISETNTKPYSRTYDKKLVLQSILHECPIAIKAVDNLDNQKVCEWNQQDKAIYVCRSDNYDLVIKAVATEIAKINLYEDTKEIDNDKADCIGYMICKKYGIEATPTGIDNLSSKYKDMETQDIANDLTSMKEVLLDINNRMGQYLDEKRKEVKNVEQER